MNDPSTHAYLHKHADTHYVYILKCTCIYNYKVLRFEMKRANQFFGPTPTLSGVDLITYTHLQIAIIGYWLLKTLSLAIEVPQKKTVLHSYTIYEETSELAFCPPNFNSIRINLFLRNMIFPAQEILICRYLMLFNFWGPFMETALD